MPFRGCELASDPSEKIPHIQRTPREARGLNLKWLHRRSVLNHLHSYFIAASPESPSQWDEERWDKPGPQHGFSISPVCILGALCCNGATQDTVLSNTNISVSVEGSFMLFHSDMSHNRRNISRRVFRGPFRQIRNTASGAILLF